MYFWDRWKFAWVQTTRRQLVGGTLGTSVCSAFLAFMFLKDGQLREELWSIGLAALGGAVIWPILVLCWNAAYAPLATTRTRVSDLEEENRQLRAAIPSEEGSDWEPLERVFKWVIEESEVGTWMDVEEKAAPAIRQAAVAGTLQLRGYKEIARHGHGERFDNVRSNISSDYWQTHDFDLTVTLDGGGSDKTRAETQVVGRTGAENILHYRGLQADMRQVKKLWP